MPRVPVLPGVWVAYSHARPTPLRSMVATGSLHPCGPSMEMAAMSCARANASTVPATVDGVRSAVGHVIAPGTAAVKRCPSNAIKADPMSLQSLQARSMPSTAVGCFVTGCGAVVARRMPAR